MIPPVLRRTIASPERLPAFRILMLGLVAALLPARASAAPTSVPIPGDGTWALFAPPAPHTGHTLVYDSRRQRMILFGGDLLGDVWALSLSGTPRWTPIVPVGADPGVRVRHSAIYDPVGDRMILYGGNDNTSNFPVGSVWALSLAGAPTWTDITPTGGPAPAARQDHGAVYDPVGRRMIVFGGGDPFNTRNDAWALSLTGTPAWSPVGAPGVPGGTVLGSFFDAARNRVVAVYPDFSGALAFWALPLGGTPAWTQLPTSSQGPGPRRSASITYDAAQDRALVFGGEYSQLFNDVWQLGFGASNDWTPIAPAGSLPPAQSGQESIFDPIGKRMVIFGGSTDCCGIRHNDTWALSLAATPRWSELVPADDPPGARSWHTAVFDLPRRRAVLFAGFAGSTSCCADTWTFEGARSAVWSQLQPSGPLPAQRYVHSAIDDAAGQRMIVYGGRAGPALDDVWALSLAGAPVWTRLSPQGASPGARYSHSAVYDPVRRRMIVFGGFSTQAYGDANDVWALALTDPPVWTKLATQGPAPFARERHTAIYDAVNDRMIVYGGLTGPEGTNAWALSLGGTPTWTELVPPPGQPKPVPRMDHVAVYDSDRQRMLVYGGLATNNREMDDLWALSLGATPSWTRLSPGGFAPGPALDQAAVYDPVKQRMIMFFTPEVEAAIRPWQLLFRSLNEPPDVSAARAVPDEIDQVNHELVPIAIAGVTDPDDDPVTLVVNRVTQDEPVLGRGSGHTCADAEVGPDGVSVRAERSGAGNGRVYRIEFTASDPSGDSSDGAVSVCVPHDRGGSGASAGARESVEALAPGQLHQGPRRAGTPSCVDDGQLYVSTAPCPSHGRGAKRAQDIGTAPGGLALSVRAVIARSVALEWTAPDGGAASVGLFDVAGRIVRRIHDGDSSAGAHRVTLDLSGVSAGVYFCRLRTAEAEITRAVIVR